MHCLAPPALALLACSLPLQEAVEDPAAPQVRALEAIEEPAARSQAGLTTHAAPGALADGATTQDWSGFLGPNRDAQCVEQPLLLDWGAAGPTLLWELKRGDSYASPVVAHGRCLFTHRQDDEVHLDCLDAETGMRYWRRSYPCEYRGRYIQNSGPRATPVVVDTEDGPRVVLPGLLGELFLLELETGRVIWERDLAAELGVPTDFFGVVASPVIASGQIILNTGAPGACVTAFELETGRIAWRVDEEWGPSCASPVVASFGGRERLFVLAGGESRPPTGGLLVLDPPTGAVVFRYPFRSRTYESVTASSPLVCDDQLFLTASYNTGSAGIGLDEDGEFEELWSSRRLGVQFSNPVFHAGHVYLLDGRSDRPGALVCLDPSSGEELSRTDLIWEEEVVYQGRERTLDLSVGEGSLLVAQDRLLCLGDNGHLLWLDVSPQGAEVLARTWLFRASETWTPPVVSHGLLYVSQNTRERYGAELAPKRLLCFDLRGR